MASQERLYTFTTISDAEHQVLNLLHTLFFGSAMIWWNHELTAQSRQQLFKPDPAMATANFTQGKLYLSDLADHYGNPDLIALTNSIRKKQRYARLRILDNTYNWQGVMSLMTQIYRRIEFQVLSPIRHSKVATIISSQVVKAKPLATSYDESRYQPSTESIQATYLETMPRATISPGNPTTFADQEYSSGLITTSTQPPSSDSPQNLFDLVVPFGYGVKVQSLSSSALLLPEIQMCRPQSSAIQHFCLRLIRPLPSAGRTGHCISTLQLGVDVSWLPWWSTAWMNTHT
ncbi:hypothetical protein CONLIGDRAFT_692449 [Coniochaeta ligniaria NRRL 30616]|uniref:Uncharacterized protein n=1 Tax=Coniochaeta ligniaria NRRL 30616 TaxID=1408157 RepID=A0A1J7J520_9PEZI|nr:hypothetical protein CONLIGDRAFT_692449 [Coniochaeta ligniaria NRRL 30616]